MTTNIWRKKSLHIDPMQKGVSLYLSYTNMNLKVCITWKSIPKLATSCNLKVIAVKVSMLQPVSELRDLSEIRSKAWERGERYRTFDLPTLLRSIHDQWREKGDCSQSNHWSLVWAPWQLWGQHSPSPKVSWIFFGWTMRPVPFVG